MRKAVLLMGILLLAAYSMAAQALDYRMYSSSTGAYNACAAEANDRNNNWTYHHPSARCDGFNSFTGRAEYYVTYDYFQAGSPTIRVSSPVRYVYVPGSAQESEYATKQEAINACINNWAGVSSNDVQFYCVEGSDSVSPFIEHLYYGVSQGMACYHHYRYNVNKAPAITINSPANGSTHYNNVLVTFQATASDPEQGNISSSIQWFIDNSTSATGTGASITRSFTAGSHTVKAKITDNKGKSAEKSITVNIFQHSIVVGSIQAVMDSPHEAHKPVVLSVSSATIDGADARSSVQWRLNGTNGALLGTGASISRTFSVGTYTVFAVLTRDGNTGSSQRTITIVDNRPHLTVQSPVSGRIFDLKENIQFSASVSLAGVNSTAAIVNWSSDIDGSLASGYNFNNNVLSEGRHVITVTAIQNGISDTKTVSLTIYDRQKNQGDENDGNCFGGNPINLLTGNKYHEETDFSTATELPLYLNRSYNSTSGEAGAFGYGWSSNIDEHVEHNASAMQAVVIGESGGAQRFDLVNGAWVDESSSRGRLEQLTSSWRYTLYDGTVKTYNASGKILSVQKISGLSLAFTYDTNGRLQAVANEFGHTLNFTYNAEGYIDQFTDPDGRVYRYTYSNGNLEYVIYPDTTVSSTDNPRKRYIYENADFPHALTGIVDEEGIRYATWAYDQYGRANFSKHGLNDEQFTVTYNVDGTTTTTNALGKKTTYEYSSVKGILKVSEVTGHQSTHCAATFQSVEYDPDTGFAAVKTDWRNNQILLEHNDFGQVTSQTVVDKGAGWTTPIDERVTTTTQYSALQLPWVITKPGLRLEQLYTPQGRIDLVTARDTTTHTVPYSTNGESRVTDYSYTLYDGTDVVRFIDINGPRTDVNDTVRYEYDIRGNLVKVTKIALNQSVQYQNHNSRGQPSRMIDENGLVTDYQYSPRGWLERETVRSAKGDAVTQYTYYKNGQLKTITAVNGSTLTYQYNDARQLLSVTNNLGEKQEYDPNDLNGDWKNVLYKTTDGVVRYQLSRSFDELGRQRNLSSPTQISIQSLNDPSGNTTRTSQTIRNPSGTLSFRLEDRYFDVFNRLRRFQGNDEAIIEYDYDLAGNLIAITVSGAQEQVTRYVYNGFGERIREDSPATGATVFYRDKAGNIVREVNAASQETLKTYDALNRLKTVTYTGASAENITYTYDQGLSGIGRLTGISDHSGGQTIVYDDQGYVDSIGYSIEGKSYSINYDFDKSGLLQRVVYPTGRQITYNRDALGRVSDIIANGAPQGLRTLITGVGYEPFGPVKSITYGNGLRREIEYDVNYRPDAIMHHWFSEQERIDYGYDTANRVRGLERSFANAQGAFSADIKSFDYDLAHRLKVARWERYNGEALNNWIEYDYDLAGNRASQRLKNQTENVITTLKAWNYSTDPFNNQLDAVSFADNGVNYQQVDSFTYGATGNVSSNGSRSYVYNRSQRLVQVNQGGGLLASYRYNAHGQRVRKQAGGKITHFHYDLQGQLLAETDQSGVLVREYVRLGDIPVAMMAGARLYEDVPSSSQHLVGQSHDRLNAVAGQQMQSLQITRGNSQISGRLGDHSERKGKEYVGFALREEKDGLSGARIDVYLSAVNSSVAGVTVVTAPDLKKVPIINWDVETKNKAFEIDVVYPNGTTHHESLARQGEWIKLERSGQYVNVYVSANGQSWTRLRQFNLAMRDEVYIGAIASNAEADLVSDYVVANDNLFYLHADHLNSVYAVSSNSSRQVVWRRNNFELGASPFGEAALLSGGSLYSGLFDMPLRFPGQYYDAETGTHYNYFRDYDPKIGRYLQSDPIGLRGGLNTYSYAKNNPLIYVDPNGDIPLVVLVPLVGGAINAVFSGIVEYKCSGDFSDALLASGVGFVSGTIGTATGMMVGLATKNVALVGSSAGLSANITEQVLADLINSRDVRVDPWKAGFATLFGAAGGVVANKVLPSGPGRPPNIFMSRSFSSMGPKSHEMLYQEAIGGTVSSTLGMATEMMQEN